MKNAFVLALDDETKENVEKFGFPVFRMHQEVVAMELFVGR